MTHISVRITIIAAGRCTPRFPLRLARTFATDSDGAADKIESKNISNSEDIFSDQKKHSFRKAFEEALRREEKAKKIGRIFEKLEEDAAAMRKERRDAEEIEEHTERRAAEEIEEKTKMEEERTSNEPKPFTSLCRTKESNPVRFRSKHNSLSIESQPSNANRCMDCMQRCRCNVFIPPVCFRIPPPPQCDG